MRPLETIVVAGAALLLVGWAMGWRARRVVPFLLLGMAAVQIVVEGQRFAMWPAYVIVVVSALGARRSALGARRGGWFAGLARRFCF